MSIQQSIRLNENLSIPVLGFGTWHMLLFKAYNSVKYAIGAGFRHIDTAPAYFNLIPVGFAIRGSGVPRDKLFVTSKLWRTQMSKNKVQRACEFTLKRLGLDYLDLYLVHWPNKDVPAEDTWSEMVKLKERGLVREIGASNHGIKHLEEIKRMNIKILMNQVEYHPSLVQKELKEYCDKNGIVMTAHSPLAQGEDLRLPLIQELAKKYDRSPVQVILNWIVSKGMCAIPSSDKPHHIEDNLKALDWELTKEEIAQIDALDRGYRLIKPDYAEFE